MEWRQNAKKIQKRMRTCEKAREKHTKTQKPNEKK